MAYKIFTRGNYFIINDDVNNVEYEGLRKEVLVRRQNSASENFYFSNINSWNDPSGGVNISDIKKENGSGYTLNEFITFYSENTGNFNKGLDIDPQNLWFLSGNSNTNESNNFIGTTNNVGVSLRTNNVERYKVYNTGEHYISLSSAGANASNDAVFTAEDLRAINATYPYSNAINYQISGNRNINKVGCNTLGLRFIEQNTYVSGSSGSQTGFNSLTLPVIDLGATSTGVTNTSLSTSPTINGIGSAITGLSSSVSKTGTGTATTIRNVSLSTSNNTGNATTNQAILSSFSLGSSSTGNATTASNLTLNETLTTQGNITNAHGITNTVIHNGTGTITNLYGIDNVVSQTVPISGSGTTRGIRNNATLVMNGNLTSGYNGYDATIAISGTGTIPTLNASIINITRTGTPAVTTCYGYRVQALQGTTKWAFANLDSTSNSMFLGKTIFGASTEPTSTFQVTGSQASSYLSITSNIILDITHRYIVIPTGSAFTITLPSAVGITGRVYKIANKTIIAKTIGSYVNLLGATVTTIPAGTSVELISNGTTWQQV